MKKPLTQGQAGFNKIRVSDRIILYSIVSNSYKRHQSSAKMLVAGLKRYSTDIYFRKKSEMTMYLRAFAGFLTAKTSLTNISAFIKQPKLTKDEGRMTIYGFCDLLKPSFPPNLLAVIMGQGSKLTLPAQH